jgi:hypothetical protein
MLRAAPAGFLVTAKQDVEVGAQHVKTAAEDVLDVTSWPEEDLAADIGVDFVWLTGLVFVVKTLAVGLYTEFKARPHTRR